MKKTKNPKTRKKKHSGRIQSWFRFDEWSGRGNAHQAARKARTARTKAGLDHKLALISKTRDGAFAYYVGKLHQIEGLKSRFLVDVK